MTKHPNKKDEMLKGFSSMEDYFKDHPISSLNSIKLNLITCLVFLLKYTYKPIRSLLGKGFNPTRNFDKVDDLKLEIQKGKTFEKDGEHFLKESDIEDFEKTGYYGPFKVLEESEAKALLEYVRSNQKDNKFKKTCRVGKAYIEGVGDNASITQTGLYSALEFEKLWDTVSHKITTQKLQSILGDDVICWRSQFFEKTPGANGTFWHQSGTFREGSAKDKLQPPKDMSTPLVNITVWMAVTESTIENGCLRILKGSFNNGYLEQFGNNILDDKLGFLMSLDNSDIKSTLKSLLFTPGTLFKLQIPYLNLFKYKPNYLEKFEPVELVMKPGEAVIFTSLNTHGSYSNVSDKLRLGFAARYTSNNVKVYNNFDVDEITTPGGLVKFSTKPLECILVAGEDNSGFNRLAERPKD